MTNTQSAAALNAMIEQATSEANKSWEFARLTCTDHGHDSFSEAANANPTISSTFVWQHQTTGRWFCA